MNVTLTLDQAKRLLLTLDGRTDAEAADLRRILHQAIGAPTAEGRFAGATVLFEESTADMREAARAGIRDAEWTDAEGYGMPEGIQPSAKLQRAWQRSFEPGAID